MDYSSVRSSVRRISNNEFANLMVMGDERPPWSRVRWINIGGISWDVITLSRSNIVSSSQSEQGAHTYLWCIELYTLALEDVLANRGPARSKADYYSKHLSLRIQCHTVQSEDEESLQLLTKSAVEKELTRSNSPEPMTVDEEKYADSAAGTTLIGSQPVSRFSTTRGGSMRKRDTTKPVEGEESAPVPASNTTKLPKLFSRSHQPVSFLFISSSHFPNVFAR